MQLPSFSVFALATVAAFGDTALAATCHGIHGGVFIGYIVEASGVPDIPGVCGGLWDNLRRFGSCAVSRPSCGADSNGNLLWEFSVPIGCNPGMVHSAWWEATQNKWGGISCS
ncbi:hypothetical protein B0I37DRAFT_409106 [Chaetomium sp. MPI-CAGE-AT-0009]|nr:hypothetical protein B0I37DRAFT_409106 [Chaetomium sp. MPI-CAGE-AT-0009]